MMHIKIRKKKRDEMILQIDIHPSSTLKRAQMITLLVVRYLHEERTAASPLCSAARRLVTAAASALVAMDMERRRNR
jgi:hypothetical protein